MSIFRFKRSRESISKRLEQLEVGYHEPYNRDSIDRCLEKIAILEAKLGEKDFENEYEMSWTDYISEFHIRAGWSVCGSFLSRVGKPTLILKRKKGFKKDG